MATPARPHDPAGPQGVLFLVVGPSGAGKDSLIAAARQALKDDPRFVFAKRAITRPRDAGGEPHEAVTEEEFAQRLDAGGFCLQWQAHGLHYGLPAQLADELDQGRSVIANVSRAVISEARARFNDVRVLLVTASADVLRARLKQRGRETPADIDLRLQRALADLPTGPNVVTVTNDGRLTDAARAFLAAITGSIPQAATRRH